MDRGDFAIFLEETPSAFVPQTVGLGPRTEKKDILRRITELAEDASAEVMAVLDEMEGVLKNHPSPAEHSFVCKVSEWIRVRDAVSYPEVVGSLQALAKDVDAYQEERLDPSKRVQAFLSERNQTAAHHHSCRSLRRCSSPAATGIHVGTFLYASGEFAAQPFLHANRGPQPAA